MSTKNIISAFMASAVALGAAHAETGLYVFGGIGATTLDQTTTRNTGVNTPTVGPAGGPSASTSDRDTSGNFYLGAGYEISAGPNLFGALEVYYSAESVETTNINNVKVTEVELDSSYGIDLKLGHNVTDTFAVYGILGITQYEYDGLASYTFAPPIDDLSDEEVAFVYGGGVEIGLTNNLSVLAEARLSNNIDLSTPVDQGGIQSDDELDIIAIRSGLKYAF